MSTPTKTIRKKPITASRRINVTILDSQYKLTVSNRVCRICDSVFYRDTKQNQHIPDNHACDECRHWYQMWEVRNEPTTVRINGEHYIIGDINAKSKGLGGQKHKIAFFDGRVVETDNLWHQGSIPIVWAMYGLTDNAKFAPAEGSSMSMDDLIPGWDDFVSHKKPYVKPPAGFIGGRNE